MRVDMVSVGGCKMARGIRMYLEGQEVASAAVGGVDGEAGREMVAPSTAMGAGRSMT